MLIKIKNAQAARHERVLVPFSKMKFSVAQILHKKGFIGEIEKKKKKLNKAELPFLEMKLAGSESVGSISGVRFISKPSRRMYVGYSEIKSVKNGYGIAVISTPKGLMTDAEARKSHVGGEILFEVW